MGLEIQMQEVWKDRPNVVELLGRGRGTHINVLKAIWILTPYATPTCGNIIPTAEMSMGKRLDLRPRGCE